MNRCKRDSCRLIVHLVELFFSFPCFDNEIKRGVEFRHSTRNVAIIGSVWGMECLNNKLPVYTLHAVKRVKLNNN